jgi:hypothetical protein
MAKTDEESRSKQHRHAIKQLAKTQNGKKVLDYLVEQAGFYKTLKHTDQKTQNDNVAVRDFVVKNIINPMNK